MSKIKKTPAHAPASARKQAVKDQLPGFVAAQDPLDLCCEAVREQGFYSIRCQRHLDHVGEHWAIEYVLDGEGGPIITEW